MTEEPNDNTCHRKLSYFTHDWKIQW